MILDAVFAMCNRRATERETRWETGQDGHRRETKRKQGGIRRKQEGGNKGETRRNREEAKKGNKEGNKKSNKKGNSRGKQ